jgi:ATP-binding cassette subfamily F protein 3
MRVYKRTALLKAISDKIIPGIPDNLRILLVSQVDDTDDIPLFSLQSEDEGAFRSSGITITERVVKSDRRRERAMAEQRGSHPTCRPPFATFTNCPPYAALLKAHEASSSSASAIAEAVFTVRLSRARHEAEEARKIAQRRSGARGSEARKQLLKAEASVEELEDR